MKKVSIWIAVALLGFLLTPAGVVVADGQPIITVQPVIASAGSLLMVKGSEMEPGEVFAISLEGIAGSILLGNATVTGAGEEGGFEVTFTIPENTPPGTYAVRAATGQGENTEADLTVTAPSAQASAGPATILETSGEPHQIERSKPFVLVMVVSAVALVSGLVGLWLVLARQVRKE